MTADQPMTPPDGPEDGPTDAARYPNAPRQTAEDPTAGGWYCGAKRSARQRTAEGDDGHMWCRLRAGQGTDHPRTGCCKLHAGGTPNHRTAARLRLRELVDPALTTLARLLAEPDVPYHVRRQAASDVLDRAGYPRRLDVDVDGAKEALLEELLALQGELGLDDDVDGESPDDPEALAGGEHTPPDPGGETPGALAPDENDDTE